MFRAKIIETGTKVTVYGIINSSCGQVAIVFMNGEWCHIPLYEIEPVPIPKED